MHYPKISIVTPSYNQGKYIEQTILSVLDQQYPNLEYIIIDGGSSDNSVEIIRKYESRISYWVSEKDDGQTDAINKGFEKCTGDIFNWINSDDYFEPDTFFKLSRYFTENPGMNVLCGKEWGFNNEHPDEKILHPGSVVSSNIFETIRIGIVDQPCTFYRKVCIGNFFPLNKSLRYVMDKQLWWSYLLKFGQGQIYCVNEVFTHFRLHPQSKSIGEQHLFELEIDTLRLSLFNNLKAEPILKMQIAEKVKPFDLVWQVAIRPQGLIIAAFATYYAERFYIKDDIQNCKKMMQLVVKHKGWQMNSKEWKLWSASCLIPPVILWRIKKL